jgi:F0F1-type ATP synthase assembly protein I
MELKPPKPVNPEGPDWRRWMGLGLEFGGVIAVFCYFGIVLDNRLGTSPWFLLSGFFLAFTGMFYLIYKEVKNMQKK